MGRPRKPTALLELSGAFISHPERKRPNEPIDSRSLGPAPKRLPKEARPFWREIEEMLPGKLLTARDRWAVELAARLMEKATRQLPPLAELVKLAVQGEINVADLRKLLVNDQISSAELSTLRSLLAALGMTPADRSKLSAPTEEKPKNKFADLAQEAQKIRGAGPGSGRPN